MDAITHVENVLLVHLTDLHIRSTQSAANQRLRDIAGGIGALIDVPTEIIILISGDIAFSGSKSQYEIAKTALADLKSQLMGWSVTNVRFVCSPGNHDCDFGAVPPAVREALLASPELDGNSPADIVEAVSATQAAYLSFSEELSDSGSIRHNAVVSESVVGLNGLKLKFLSLNTSWSSRNPERASTLRMPAALLPEISKDAEFCIALAHHPLNWFTPPDAVHLSEWLDSTVDMVLWGHEHRLDEFRLVRQRVGSSVAHQIGLPVDDADAQCGFKCFRIDLGDMSTTEFDVLFVAGGCKAKETCSGSLHHNDGRDRGVVRFSKAHVQFLQDPGAGFSHPRINRPITLSDLFIAPEFREFQSDKVGLEKIDGNVSLAELYRAIASDEGRYVVFGGEASGKTTFAKHLIGSIRGHRLTPMYFDGALLKSLNRGDVKGWIRGAVASQYAADSVDELLSTDPRDVVAIIDNAHSIPGGSEGVDFVSQAVSARAKRLILLTADNPAVSIVTSGQQGDELAYWKGAEVFELLPLGHKRRGELIRRWVSLGRNELEDSTAIEAEVRQVKGLLDRVLGKNSLPKYPLFVLVLLQQLEGMRGNRTAVANGSHGYLFEALISQSIDKYVRSHEIGTVNDFLAEIAYEVWKRNGSSLSQSAIEDIIEGFLAELVSIDGKRLLKELDDARVVLSEGGLFRFRYQYLYYYYLAKWICANKGTQEADSIVTQMVDFVHTEQSSNVLMFVAHLKEEQLVISKLVPLLDALFSDCTPSVLEDYSGLSVRFKTTEQRAVLLQGPPRDVSDEHHRDMDHADDAITGTGGSAQVEDGLKFNTTLKAIHTLGQVLKSRATSIPPDQKIEVAKSAMLAGRRLMAFLYEITESNAESIVRSASEAFEKAFKLDREQAIRVANAMIGVIVGSVANICVGRIGDALGSGELRPLLDRLSSDMDDDDSQLVLLVARIIGEKTYPKEAVEDFVRKLRPANVLPVGVLAATVARRFYLDPPDRGIRESACTLLGINVKKVPGRVHQVPKPQGTR